MKKIAMIIGITYDLKEDYISAGYTTEETAEFDKPDTIDAIETILRDFGFETKRIGNVTNLVKCLARGDRWDLVFNIAEGLYGFGREAQVPCLLDAYDIPYTFSDPLVLSLTLHKGMCKRIIHDLGIPTPAFVIVESESDIKNVTLRYPLFAKPIAEGTGKGITATSMIQNYSQLQAVCKNLLVHYNQPVLVETYLPGPEFTVGIIGTGKEAKSIGVMEILLKEQAECNFYTHYNKENYKDLVEYRLVYSAMADRAKQMALAVWQGIGCRDAGRIDVRVDEMGIPNILEINPLAGLDPANSDLPILSRLVGIKFKELIGMILRSALLRVGLPQSVSLANAPFFQKKVIH
ncbi:MAG: D-alanine--D-alanine ligase family protein [bacterium]